MSSYIRIEMKGKEGKIGSITWEPSYWESETDTPSKYAITFVDGKWGIADRDFHSGMKNPDLSTIIGMPLLPSQAVEFIKAHKFPDGVWVCDDMGWQLTGAKKRKQLKKVKEIIEIIKQGKSAKPVDEKLVKEQLKGILDNLKGWFANLDYGTEDRHQIAYFLNEEKYHGSEGNFFKKHFTDELYDVFPNATFKVKDR